MKHSPFVNQRGVAMLIELILVAAVLGLIGLAVYQANHRTGQTPTTSSAANDAGNLAASAATAAAEDAAADDVLGAEAEAAIGDLDDTDSDVSNLGDTTNVKF